jgi:hypothetical protein
MNKRWSARAEYLFADFGKVSNVDLTGASWDDVANPFTHAATLKSNIGRIAINYRF